MKIFWCPHCWDVRKCSSAYKPLAQCECGESGGQYHADDHCATFYGKAIPIGLSNKSLMRAAVEWSVDGEPRDVESWVFDRTYQRINFEDIPGENEA